VEAAIRVCWCPWALLFNSATGCKVAKYGDNVWTLSQMTWPNFKHLAATFLSWGEDEMVYTAFTYMIGELTDLMDAALPDVHWVALKWYYRILVCIILCNKYTDTVSKQNIEGTSSSRNGTTLPTSSSSAIITRSRWCYWFNINSPTRALLRYTSAWTVVATLCLEPSTIGPCSCCSQFDTAYDSLRHM